MHKRRFCLQPEESPGSIIDFLYNFGFAAGSKIVVLIRNTRIYPTRSRPRMSFREAELQELPAYTNTNGEQSMFSSIAVEPASLVFWNFSRQMRLRSLHNPGLPNDRPIQADLLSFIYQEEDGCTILEPTLAFTQGISLQETLRARDEYLQVRQSLVADTDFKKPVW